MLKEVIIAHGEQTEEALPYYRTAFLTPLAAALSSIQMQVTGMDAAQPDEVVFGISRLYKPDDSILVKIEHDWKTIRQRVEQVMVAEIGG